MFLALGVHPKSAGAWGLEEYNTMTNGLRYEEFNERLLNLYEHVKDRVVSWGEIGLDYSHACCSEEGMKMIRPKQIAIFKEHIRYAIERNLPIQIHSRK